MMTAAMGVTFGSGDDSDAIGMDMTGFVMEMPLLSLLQFQEEGPLFARRGAPSGWAAGEGAWDQLLIPSQDTTLR